MKKLFSFILLISLLTGFSIAANAREIDTLTSNSQLIESKTKDPNNGSNKISTYATLLNQNQYMEESFQINFSDINLKISDDNDKLIITKKTNLSNSRNNEIDQQLENLQSLFKEFPEIEKNIISDAEASTNNLLAVSFTIAPLTLVDGNYERVPLNNARGYEVSDSNSKGKFVLYTTVYGGTEALAGKYKYIGKTYGSWSNNIIGGSNYPDAGVDYILQTTPNTFARKSATLGVEYDASPTIGVSGTDYWAQTGGTNYVRYAIEDDPVGVRQCKSFILSTTSSGPKSTNIRHISSYYVHTWDEMTLSVRITSSDSQSVALELVPEYTTKNWQLYNPVSLEF